jgi:hypothetical protein
MPMTMQAQSPPTSRAPPMGRRCLLMWTRR